MVSVRGYLYEQRIDALVDNEGTQERTNRMAYSNPLRFERHLDNSFVIRLLNRDQKPVNAGGYSYQYRIIDPSDGSEMLSLPMRVEDGIRGIIRGLVRKSDLVPLTRDSYHYSVIRRDANGGETAVFVDDNYNSAGTLVITGSAYPNQSRYNRMNVDYSTGTSISGLLAVTSDVSQLHSLALYLTDYTGVITVLGHIDSAAEPNNNDYFEVYTQEVVSFDGVYPVNVTGAFQGLKVKFETSTGLVSQIQHRY